MSWKDVILLVCLGMGVFSFLTFYWVIARKARSGEEVLDAAWDSREIRLTTARQEVIKIPWGELAEVAIVTNDLGPYADDVFLELTNSSGERYFTFCTSSLLARFQELPGFDNEQVTKAMCCTDDARFVCWVQPRGTVQRNSDGGRSDDRGNIYVTNSLPQTLKFTLEPWCDQRDLKSGETLRVSFTGPRGKTDVGVEVRGNELVLWGWSGSVLEIK